MFRELKEEPLWKLRRWRRTRKLVFEILIKALFAILAGVILGLMILGVTEPYEAVAETVAEETETAAEKQQVECTVPATEEETISSAYDMTVEAETEGETTATELEETWELLGTFTLTAYCSCRKCCGRWSGGPTDSGTMPAAGRTIAVDKRVIPLGTTVYIEGYGEFIAEDTGSAVRGNHIDIYMDSHEAARWFADGAGSCKAKVYIIE